MRTEAVGVLEQAVERIVFDLLAKGLRRAAASRDVARKIQELDHLSHTFPMDDSGVIALLNDAEVAGIRAYGNTPEFERIVLQAAVVASLRGDQFRQRRTDLLNATAAELSDQLRHFAQIQDPNVDPVAGAIFKVVLQSCQRAADTRVTLGLPGVLDLAISGHVAAAAMRGSAFFKNVDMIHSFHAFADDLRAQVRGLHATMRLPLTGASRAMSYAELFVDPPLERDQITYPFGAVLHPPARAVVLGDPGGGKSTLLAKLAYDLASDAIPGPLRVPLLLVMRDYTDELRQGKHDLGHYLHARCRDPYNLRPPKGALEYLLLNGHAVVLLDGLDELTDIRMRHRVIELIEGFVLRYPLTPVVATSRRIGYDEAPLSSDLFTTYHLAGFEKPQIATYAAKWFAANNVDDPEHGSRLTTEFLAESETVTDLRSNPLLLSLLCGMYATTGYIPANRPDVYEKCAMTLFEQWDRTRRIGGPRPLSVRIKPAVQYLAWQLFTQPGGNGLLDRQSLTELLAAYMRERRFSELDEALDAAEAFLSYCTGRAWILSDVGTDRRRTLYGFTHRTFLEYFAAAYLASRSGPHELVEELQPHVERGEWDVMAPLAVQILDRTTEDAGDTALEMLLEAAGRSALRERANLLAFVVRTLEFVTPRERTIRRIAHATVGLAAESTAQMRGGLILDSDQRDAVRMRDAPLIAMVTLAYGTSDNGQMLVRALVDALSEAIASDPSGLFLLLLVPLPAGGVSFVTEAWEETKQTVVERWSTHISAWAIQEPWFAMRRALDTLSGVPDAIARFGAQMVFQRVLLPGVEVQLASLLADLPAGAAHQARRLWRALVAAPIPWILLPPREPGAYEGATIVGSVDRYPALASWDGNADHRALQVLLSLPDREIARAASSAGPDPGWPDEAAGDLTRFPTEVAAMLESWSTGQLHVVEFGSPP